MSSKSSGRRGEPWLIRQLRSPAAALGLRGERVDLASGGRARARGDAGPHLRYTAISGGRDGRDKGPPGAARGGEPPKTPRRPAGRRRRSPLGWLLRWLLTLLIWGFVAILAMVAYYAYDLPDVSNLAALTRRPSVTLVGADGQPFATFGDLYYDAVPLKEMPPYLPKAVLATEDRRFYEHFGIDPLGILRALVENIRSGQIRQGGSTITQQLAKNLFLTPERTVRRKVQEILLAVWLEHKFSKDQILTIYLNRVYLGAGAFGVEAAAHKYFGRSAREISLYQAAVLAGLLKAPSRFNPAANPDLTADRASQVLQSMVDAGFLTPERAAAAGKAREELKPAAVAAWRGRYFADWAVDQVRDLLGYVDRDLVVVTTFDPRLQRIAEGVVAASLDKEGAKLEVSQGAVVALAPDGAVRALVGGRDYRASQFDRAVQALRQPGSAFKPFVYLAGLEAGYEPDSVFNDAPIAIGNWHPNNYDDKYYGRVPLHEALARSLNSVAAQLAEKAGVQHVVEAAHRLGITSELRPDLSLALGTSEVSLLEITAAYGGFANGGKGVWPYGVVEVHDRDGHVLYRRTGSGPGAVMTQREAATMVQMLSEVLAYGTGKGAALGRPAAGKTGTTQDYRDAWFIGFTPDLIAGVWVGNDDGTPMKKVTGGRLPAHMWHDFMVAALADTPAHEFAQPPSLFDQIFQSLLGGSGGHRAAASGPSGPPKSPTATIILPNGAYKTSQ